MYRRSKWPSSNLYSTSTQCCILQGKQELWDACFRLLHSLNLQNWCLLAGVLARSQVTCQIYHELSCTLHLHQEHSPIRTCEWRWADLALMETGSPAYDILSDPGTNKTSKIITPLPPLRARICQQDNMEDVDDAEKEILVSLSALFIHGVKKLRNNQAESLAYLQVLWICI